MLFYPMLIIWDKVGRVVTGKEHKGGFLDGVVFCFLIYVCYLHRIAQFVKIHWVYAFDLHTLLYLLFFHKNLKKNPLWHSTQYICDSKQEDFQPPTSAILPKALASLGPLSPCLLIPALWDKEQNELIVSKLGWVSNLVFF